MVNMAQNVVVMRAGLSVSPWEQTPKLVFSGTGWSTSNVARTPASRRVIMQMNTGETKQYGKVITGRPWVLGLGTQCAYPWGLDFH